MQKNLQVLWNEYQTDSTSKAQDGVFLQKARLSELKIFFFFVTSIATSHNSYKLKEGMFQLHGEALGQVAQRGCGCPIPGSVQGQVGWGFEQPGLVEGVPAHGSGVGTR